MGTVRRKVFEAKQWLYRFMKYLWLRPKPWVDPTLANKKVVVVGSAPMSSKPVGLDGSYRVITINAAQQALQGWGISNPDITVMMFNQIEGENTNAREVRQGPSRQTHRHALPDAMETWPLAPGGWLEAV